MKEIEEMLKMAREGYEAEITQIEDGTSKEYFGDQTPYEDRKGYIISFKVITDKGDGEDWDEFFALPKSRGFKASKIGMFCTKYGEIPKKGTKVKAEINDNGFFGVVL